MHGPWGGGAWSQGVPGGDPPATAAGGTHPTGMHSCNYFSVHFQPQIPFEIESEFILLIAKSPVSYEFPTLKIVHINISIGLSY